MCRHVHDELDQEGDGEDVLEGREGGDARASSVQLSLKDVDDKAEHDQNCDCPLNRNTVVNSSQAEAEFLDEAGPCLLEDNCLVGFFSEHLQPLVA